MHADQECGRHDGHATCRVLGPSLSIKAAQTGIGSIIWYVFKACAIAFLILAPFALLHSTCGYLGRIAHPLPDARAIDFFANARVQLADLQKKYPAHLLAKHTIISEGLADVLVPRLLNVIVSSNTSGGNFTIGVTGGSSTAGRFAWPGRLLARLTRQLHLPNVDLRNAAVGSTSQLVTSMCIRTLVGDNIDLLMWEFGMNDEHPEFMNGTGHISQHYYRHRVSEAYIRQAIALQPLALGLGFFWDIEIHQYQGVKGGAKVRGTLPDRSFHPTSSVMRYYNAVYDRYFAVNVIGFMFEAGLFRNKSEILRDAHHPNNLAYNVAVDLVAYCLLKTVNGHYLRADAASHQPQPPSFKRRQHYPSQAESLWAYPTLTHAADTPSPYVLPSQRLLGHCLLPLPPAFQRWPAADVGIQVSDNPFGVIDVGKEAIGREDRQMRFALGPCSDQHKLTFTVNIPNATYVFVDCGRRQATKCTDHLVVVLDGERIQPNVDVRNDVMRNFYGWVHKLTKTSAQVPWGVQMCSSSNVSVSRLVVMQQT